MQPTETPKLNLKSILTQPFGENTYVANLEGSPECLVVDPGLEPDKIIAYLEEAQLEPAAILNTHGHSDHIGGNEVLKDRWPDCPLVIGRGDAGMLTDPMANLSEPFGVPLTSPAADEVVEDGQVYSAAGFDLRVWEIPGHSPGHVVFVWEAHEPMVVFGGDVLFAGSIGRTDFPGGSLERLAAGIRQKLYTLADDTVILPGHGPPTTVGHEKRTNPFVPAE